jgi:hypothetical protein
VLSLLTILACGVVLLIDSLATLPPSVLLVVAVLLLLSIVAWSTAVFRDARSSGVRLGGAVWKSVGLTWKAVWELLP